MISSERNPGLEYMTLVLGVLCDDGLACGYSAPQGLEGAPKLGQNLLVGPEHAGQPYQAQNLRA